MRVRRVVRTERRTRLGGARVRQSHVRSQRRREALQLRQSRRLRQVQLLLRSQRRCCSLPHCGPNFRPRVSPCGRCAVFLWLWRVWVLPYVCSSGFFRLAHRRPRKLRNKRRRILSRERFPSGSHRSRLSMSLGRRRRMLPSQVCQPAHSKCESGTQQFRQTLS